MIRSLSRVELLKMVCAYGIFALVSYFFQQNVFSLIYFICVSFAIFFIEPVLTEDSTVKHKIYFNFLLFTVFFGATYESFDLAIGNLAKLMSATGTSLLLAGLIAVTDRKKFNYCVLIIPVLFFIDKKLCICSSALFLTIFILNLFLEPKTKQKKGKKKKEPATSQLNVVYVLVSLLGLIASIVLYVTTSAKHSDLFSYFVSFGLNCFPAVLIIVYILIKLVRNDSAFIRPIAIGLLILVGTSVFCAVYVNFATLAVSILSTLFFLVYCCLQSSSTIDSIKADYERNKFAFWIAAMLMLI